MERLEAEVTVPRMERMEERVGKKQTVGFGLGIRCAHAIVQDVAKEYGNGWIPFEMREMDEEEKRCNGVEDGYILNCPLPDEDEEILVTYSNGTVDVDIFMCDGNECYLDSGNDLVTEAIAWRKKPAPYQKGE